MEFYCGPGRGVHAPSLPWMTRNARQLWQLVRWDHTASKSSKVYSLPKLRHVMSHHIMFCGGRNMLAYLNPLDVLARGIYSGVHKGFAPIPPWESIISIQHVYKVHQRIWDWFIWLLRAGGIIWICMLISPHIETFEGCRSDGSPFFPPKNP